MDRIPRAGEFYRHFKNHLYQIITVASHTETGEELVVYQALYGSYRTYARPLSMFAGEVDHEKYPEVSQKYRFERVDPGSARDSDSQPDREADLETNPAPEDADLPEWLIRFLDTDQPKDRLEILAAVKNPVEQKDLDSLYVVLDMPPQKGGWKEQIREICKHLKTLMQYEGGRLR